MLIQINEKTSAKIRALAAEYETKHADFIARKDASRAASATIEVTDFGDENLKLMPFQSAGVDYALNHAVNPGRTFLADEQGLGKTVQALAIVHHLGAYPAVIVCESHTKYNWARECSRWVKDVHVEVVEGTKPVTLNGGIVIINYDILKHHVEQLVAHGVKALIVDESHRVKNPKAQRTQALTKIAASLPADGPLLCLTGTAILNRPRELVTQLRLLGLMEHFARPGDEPRERKGVMQTMADVGEARFLFAHCGAEQNPHGWTFSGASNLDGLNDKLRGIGYVRRLKSDVLPELPAKMPRVVIPLDITNRASYTKAEKEFDAWCEEQGEDAPMDAEHLVKITALRHLAAQGKFKAAVKWVQSFLEQQDKLIVFAAHIDIQQGLLAAFPGSAKVIGDMTAMEKTANVDRFQNDPDCKLIVCSLKAANTGITLTAAHDVAFIELGWTSTEHDQAEDRAHRIGQGVPVTPYYLLAHDTIDEDMAELIESKREVTTATNQGGEAAAKLNLMGNLLSRLRERRAA